MIRRTIAVTVLAVALLSGCQSPAEPNDLFAEIAPPQGKALVCFYRPNIWPDSSPVGVELKHEDAKLGPDLYRREHRWHVVEPGRHRYEAGGQRLAYVIVDAEPDKTYYVFVSQEGATFLPEAHLRLMDSRDPPPDVLMTRLAPDQREQYLN